MADCAVPPTGKPSAIPHICIAGGGFGGLYSALALHRQLRRHRQQARITLVEPRAQFLFTPLLYETLTGELTLAEVTPDYDSLLAHTRVAWRQTQVTSIDLKAACCELDDGTVLPYDYLVVALGSRQRAMNPAPSPDPPLGFTTRAHLTTLLAQLQTLEQSGRKTIRGVVVGAGPSGVELACKLADRLGDRGEVALIDRRGVILRACPPAIQRSAQRALQARRVQVMTSIQWEGTTEDGLHVVYQGEPHHLPYDLMVWTVGTLPRSWPGHSSMAPSLTNHQQYEVQPSLQLVDYPQVFVVGDMAAMGADGPPVPMTAQAAYQAAPAVAANIRALMAGRRVRPFRYHHLGQMLTLGRGQAIVHGMGLCLTGRVGGIARLGAYWLRLPTWGHRWRVLAMRLRIWTGDSD